MTRYVTAEEYTRLCPNGTADESKLVHAEYDIDSLTFNRIGKVGLDTFPEAQRRCIVRAVCLQADFLDAYGDAIDNPLSSYGINGISMSWDKSKLMTVGSVNVPRTVYSLLQQTGLTYRGMDWRPG